MGLKDELGSLSGDGLRRAIEETGSTSLKSQLEGVQSIVEDASRSLASQLQQVAQVHSASELRPGGISYVSPHVLPRFRPVSPEERQAEVFFEGLKKQTRDLEEGLGENQELRMFCYHGLEKVQVLEINMPSHNVVSMRCVDCDGNETHVTGHMNSVTFSYLVYTIEPPKVRTPIGFNMAEDE